MAAQHILAIVCAARLKSSNCALADVPMVVPADRYFSSFPKVGIVIPNPAIWLLPEFQDLAMSLSTTLSLPNDASLLHGAYVEPTSDGFLIQLPSCEPLSPGNKICSFAWLRLKERP